MVNIYIDIITYYNLSKNFSITDISTVCSTLSELIPNILHALHTNYSVHKTSSESPATTAENLKYTTTKNQMFYLFDVLLPCVNNSFKSARQQGMLLHNIITISDISFALSTVDCLAGTWLNRDALDGKWSHTNFFKKNVKQTYTIIHYSLKQCMTFVNTAHYNKTGLFYWLELYAAELAKKYTVPELTTIDCLSFSFANIEALQTFQYHELSVPIPLPLDLLN